MKLRLKMFLKSWSWIRFSNYSAKSKYFDDPNKLVVDKMKDETTGVAIEEFVLLKPKMYLLLVDSD